MGFYEWALALFIWIMSLMFLAGIITIARISNDPNLDSKRLEIWRETFWNIQFFGLVVSVPILMKIIWVIV